jgi:predicted NBD/HSP70 family sugar kinase
MYILIDIGGTKTRIATAETTSAKISLQDKMKTPQDPNQAVDAIANTISQNVSGSVTAVSVGVAGSVATDGRIHFSPNLPDWQEFDLASKLKTAIGVENVYVLNDTAVGALGEAHEGAGKDVGVSAYITVGTGVGGSRIVDGKLDTVAYGFEPGHQVVNIDAFCDLDDLPREGRVPGHLEYYLSGANIERRTGHPPPEVKDEDLWDEFQERLLAALINVSVMWSPDVIVIGGSMIFRNEFLSFAYLQKQLEKKLTIYSDVPTVQRAVLQDDAGLIGARVFLRTQK